MTRQKKLLMWTVFIVALVQTVGIALSPALNQIKTAVFPERSLTEIQTAFMLPGLISPLVAFLTAELIRRGLVTKKAVVITGLFLLGAAGLLSLVLHQEFWQLRFLYVLMGIAAGCYLSTMISIMMDGFRTDERQKVTGLQAVFVNIGGFMAGIFGGMLASWTWYGGFLILLVGIPMGVFSIFSIPTETRIRRGRGAQVKTKATLQPDIFFYGATLFVFMLIFGVSAGNLAVSHCVDVSTSALATSIITGIAPGLGGFLSPIVFTNLTNALVRDSTNFRYQFVAFAAL